MASALQGGTLLIAAATLVGAFVGAFVQVGWRVWTERRRKTHLRWALRSEILTMRPYLVGQRGPEDQFLRHTVYKNNSEDIGMLSREEVEKVVGFYGTVTNVQRAVDSSDTDHMDTPNAPTLIIETGVQAWFNAAIQALDQHLDSNQVDSEEEIINLEPSMG